MAAEGFADRRLFVSTNQEARVTGSFRGGILLGDSRARGAPCHCPATACPATLARSSMTTCFVMRAGLLAVDGTCVGFPQSACSGSCPNSSTLPSASWRRVSSTRDTLRARQRRGHVLASELRHGKGKLRRKQGRRCYGVWGFSQPKVCVTCAVVWCHHDLLQPLPAFSHPSWRHIRTWYGPWGGWSGSQQRTPQAAWLFKMPRPGPPCMDS